MLIDLPFGPGCPWYELHNLMPPNVKWCEAPLCSVVMEPANAWSNLAYLFVGLFLLLTRPPARGPSMGPPGPLGPPLDERRQFGLGAIAVGVTSGVYHATNNWPTQLFDFLGMYVFIFLLLCRNLTRMGVLPAARTTAAYFGGVALMTALTPLWREAGLPVQAIVGLLILGVLFTEWRAGARQALDRRFFFVSLGLLTLGAVCSLLDVTRLYCNPQSHVLQGHAVWHVLTALSLGAACRYYRQFAADAG